MPKPEFSHSRAGWIWELQIVKGCNRVQGPEISAVAPCAACACHPSLADFAEGKVLLLAGRRVKPEWQKKGRLSGGQGAPQDFPVVLSCGRELDFHLWPGKVPGSREMIESLAQIDGTAGHPAWTAEVPRAPSTPQAPSPAVSGCPCPAGSSESPLDSAVLIMI